MLIHDKLMYGVPNDEMPYQYQFGTAFEVSIFADDENMMYSSSNQRNNLESTPIRREDE